MPFWAGPGLRLAALLISGYLGVSDFEGARAMTAMGFGPMGGLVGLIGGTWLTLRLRGVRGFKANLTRMPLVISGIAALTAGGFWIAYEMRPNLNDNGAPPQLQFEMNCRPAPNFRPRAMPLASISRRKRTRCPAASSLDKIAWTETGR